MNIFCGQPIFYANIDVKPKGQSQAGPWLPNLITAMHPAKEAFAVTRKDFNMSLWEHFAWVKLLTEKIPAVQVKLLLTIKSLFWLGFSIEIGPTKADKAEQKESSELEAEKKSPSKQLDG